MTDGAATRVAVTTGERVASVVGAVAVTVGVGPGVVSDGVGVGVGLGWASSDVVLPGAGVGGLDTGPAAVGAHLSERA